MASESHPPEESPTKIIVSGTNGETLHEDPPDGSPDANPPKHSTPEIGSSNPLEQNGPQDTSPDGETISKPEATPLTTDEYLEKYKINVLFEELIFRTLDKTPENPLKFLLSSMKSMDEENWQPGESFSEKAEAVQKIFKIHAKETDTDKPKVGAHPGSAGTRPPGKVTPAVRTPAKTTNPPKTAPVSTRPTPGRTVTQSKTAVNPRPTTTPVKTNTTAPAKTATNSTPPKTGATATARKTGGTSITGAGAKTGSNSSISKAPAPKTTAMTTRTTTGAAKTGATGRTGTTGGATAKTGSNPSLTKSQPAPRTTTTTRTTVPPRTGVKSTTSTIGARGPSTPKATGKAVSGGIRGSAKSGALGNNPRTKSGTIGGKPSSGAKKTEPTVTEPEITPEVEPEPKDPTPPAEEAKPPTPIEEDPHPKPPTIASSISDSEEPEGPVLDSDDLVAQQEVHYDSEDEPPATASIPEPKNLVSIEIVVEKPERDSASAPTEEQNRTKDEKKKFMTSKDYAQDLQAIEDQAELDVRHNAELNELADEGIDVDPEALFTPRMEGGNDTIFSSEQLISSDRDPPSVPSGIPTLPASSTNVLSAYQSAKEVEEKNTESPTDVQILELGAEGSEQTNETEPKEDLKTPSPDRITEIQIIEASPVNTDYITTETPNLFVELAKPDSPVSEPADKTSPNEPQSPNETEDKPTIPVSQSPTEIEANIDSPPSKSLIEIEEKTDSSPSKSPIETDQSPIDSGEGTTNFSPPPKSSIELFDTIITTDPPTANKSTVELFDTLMSQPPASDQSPPEIGDKNSYPTLDDD